MILVGQYTSLDVLINKTLDLFFNLITKAKYFCLQNKVIEVKYKTLKKIYLWRVLKPG